jgi:hypothetical protein
MSQSYYGKWLAHVLDVDGKYKSTINMLSTFDQLEYKGVDQCTRYAKVWCRLAEFLWTHRHLQLYSTRVEPMFRVDRTTSVNIYWFEVLRACDTLVTTTMQDLTRDLRMLDVTPTKAYAAVVEEDLAVVSSWDKPLQSIRNAIGVCNYTINVAANRCVFMHTYAGMQLQSVQERYQTLRIMGCWVQARRLMTTHDYEVAQALFTTVGWMGEQNKHTVMAACFLQSTSYLITICIIKRMVRAGKPGFAVAFAREAALVHASDCSSLADHIARLQPGDAVVPPKGSPLLKTWKTHVIEKDILRQGSNALEIADDAPEFELKSSASGSGM